MLNTRLIRLSIVPLILFVLLGSLSFLPRPIYAADPGLADIGSDGTPTLTSTVNGMQVGFVKENNKTTIWLRVCANSPYFQLRSEHVGLWITEVFNRTTAANGCSPSPTSWWKMVINADPNPNEVFRIYATANDTLLSESAFMQRAARTDCRVTGYGVGYCTPSSLQPVSAQTGWIDQPAVNESVQGTIMVRGWAADAGSLNGSGVSNVQVRINGTLVGSANYGGSRPDVAAYLGDSRFTNTGYQLAVNVSNFPSGSATLQVNYQSAISGVWHSLERQIMIVTNTYTISGRVTTSSGVGLGNVTISDGTRSAMTDSNGNYTLTSVPAGNYVLRPSRSGYNFEPTSRSISVGGNVSGQNFTATPVTTTKTWTFLLYMDSEDENLYPSFQRAIESLEALPANPNLKLVVLIDGPANGDTRRMLIQPGGKYTLNVNTWNLGEQNVGNPQTLQQFIDWGQTTYPADYYYLSVADHGNGNLGIAWDRTNGNDYLTTTELRTAIAGGTNNGQRKIHVLHYDACLMGLLENAYQVKDYVDYLVFAQNLGWSLFGYGNYAGGITIQSTLPQISSIAATITAMTTPRQLATDIATTYFNSLSGYPRTITAVDMSQINMLHQAVDNFAAQLSANLNNTDVAIQNTRIATQMFDSNANYNIGPDDEYADLYDFARRIKINVNINDVKSAAQTVMNAVDSVVISEYHWSGNLPRQSNYYGLDNSHGISIYFPPRSGSNGYNRYISHQNFSFTTTNRWDDFLKDYFGMAGLAPETGDTLMPVPLLDASQRYKVYIPLINR